jgi:hypothetical protein
MRSPAAIAAAVLLVGCTDRPIATAVQRAVAPAAGAAAAAANPTPGLDRIPNDTTTPDLTPIMSRVEATFSPTLSQIAIPADAFSTASDAVHPDVVCDPASWNGARCWMTYTPYLNSNPTWENPSFLAASADTSWTLPPGVTNPVVPWPGVGAYNSDPDQGFDPGTGRLVTFYRRVDGTYNNILIMSTADGRTWSQPKLAFREVNHNAVSPAVVIDAQRNARVWYVQSGVGCTSSTTSVAMRTARPDSGQAFEDAAWSDPVGVRMSQPGFAIWHMDVIALPQASGYLAVLASHPTGSDCASDDLWLAISPDGIQWRVFAVPILWRGMAAAKKLGIQTWYRTAVRYDPATDILHIWPSALTVNNRWNIYHAQANLTGLLRTLMAATPADQPAADLHRASRVPNAVRARMP